MGNNPSILNSRLERQVICRTFSSRLLSRRERGCGISTTHRLLWREWRGYWSTCYRRNGGTSLYVIGADIVEPAALVFASIDIELNGDVLAHLDIELLDAVLTEDVEYHFARVLARYFDDIFLSHPRITCTLRNTTAGL